VAAAAAKSDAGGGGKKRSAAQAESNSCGDQPPMGLKPMPGVRLGEGETVRVQIRTTHDRGRELGPPDPLLKRKSSRVQFRSSPKAGPHIGGPCCTFDLMMGSARVVTGIGLRRIVSCGGGKDIHNDSCYPSL
jgi:hypothetical protein